MGAFSSPVRHSLPGQPSARCCQQWSGASPPPWGATRIMSGDQGDQSPPETPLNIPMDGPSPAAPWDCSHCGAVALTVWMVRFEHWDVMLAEQRVQKRMSTAGRLQTPALGVTVTSRGTGESWGGRGECHHCGHQAPAAVTFLAAPRSQREQAGLRMSHARGSHSWV